MVEMGFPVKIFLAEGAVVGKVLVIAFVKEGDNFKMLLLLKFLEGGVWGLLGVVEAVVVGFKVLLEVVLLGVDLEITEEDGGEVALFIGGGAFLVCEGETEIFVENVFGVVGFGGGCSVKNFT